MLCVVYDACACAAVEEWGEGIKAFIASGALDGHRLIPVGHSLGATAL